MAGGLRRTQVQIHASPYSGQHLLLHASSTLLWPIYSAICRRTRSDRRRLFRRGRRIRCVRPRDQRIRLVQPRSQQIRPRRPRIRRFVAGLDKSQAFWWRRARAEAMEGGVELGGVREGGAARRSRGRAAAEGRRQRGAARGHGMGILAASRRREARGRASGLQVRVG
jgi:hypothetical protein